MYLSRFATVTLSLLFAIGCSDAVTGPNASEVDKPGNLRNERVSIINEEVDLQSRISYSDQDVEIEGGEATHKAKFNLKLVAEVASPEIDGKTLQATSVYIDGDYAIVSYAMSGEDYLGCIDVFEIRKGKNVRLMSSALFEDADVFAASYFDGYVQMAQSTSDASFDKPSVLESLRLNGHNLVLDDNRRMGLFSHVATSVKSTGSGVYVTYGAAGGLAVLDPVTWEARWAVDLHDARWVDVADGRIAVVSGTPGRLSVFDEATLEHVNTFKFEGSDVAEAKSTIRIVGDRAFVAAGPGGVKVISLVSGNVLGNIPRPDPEVVGLDPDDVVTNAVAVDEDLLFISNGGAGIYVAQGGADFATGGDDPVDLELIGRLRFGGMESANHVACQDENVFVAAGLGGVKVVKVKR